MWSRTFWAANLLTFNRDVGHTFICAQRLIRRDVASEFYCSRFVLILNLSRALLFIFLFCCRLLFKSMTVSVTCACSCRCSCCDCWSIIAIARWIGTQLEWLRGIQRAWKNPLSNETATWTPHPDSGGSFYVLRSIKMLVRSTHLVVRKGSAGLFKASVFMVNALLKSSNWLTLKKKAMLFSWNYRESPLNTLWG